MICKRAQPSYTIFGCGSGQIGVSVQLIGEDGQGLPDFRTHARQVAKPPESARVAQN
jgi:hypothetical protein